MKYRDRKNKALKLFDSSYGSYIPAFALIEIEDIIDFQNFENNHDELKGTFIHEYCHYLQDVSTTCGFINFIYGLQELFLKLGMVINLHRKDIQYNRDILGLLRGDDEIENDIFYINKIEIKPHEFLQDYPEEEVKCVIVTYNGKLTFCFGSLCISESMAYLVEKRLYRICERESEFPYNVCEMICIKEYPEFAKNELFVLALCEISLLERNAGIFFITALRLMKEKNFLPKNILDMEEFLDKYFEVGFRGYRNQIDNILNDLYPGKNEEFVKVRQWIISRFELGCIYREQSKMFISLSLSSENIQERYGRWQYIMNHFGCPIVIVKGRNVFEGGYLEGKSIDLRYMLGPWAIETAFAREGKSCPLKEICKMDQDKKYSSLCEERLKEKLKIDNNCFLGLFFKAYNIEI